MRTCFILIEKANVMSQKFISPRVDGPDTRHVMTCDDFVFPGNISSTTRRELPVLFCGLGRSLMEPVTCRDKNP